MCLFQCRVFYFVYFSAVFKIEDTEPQYVTKNYAFVVDWIWLTFESSQTTYWSRWSMYQVLSQLLSSGDFKNKLISWKTNRKSFWKITTCNVIDRACQIIQIMRKQILILHAKHASLTHQDVDVSSPDTYVFVIALS